MPVLTTSELPLLSHKVLTSRVSLVNHITASAWKMLLLPFRLLYPMKKTIMMVMALVVIMKMLTTASSSPGID